MSSILRSLVGYIADCHYDGIFCQETCFRVLPNVLQQLAFPPGVPAQRADAFGSRSILRKCMASSICHERIVSVARYRK
jgi:hypothetical protein